MRVSVVEDLGGLLSGTLDFLSWWLSHMESEVHIRPIESDGANQ